jgi:hypothetical protein
MVIRRMRTDDPGDLTKPAAAADPELALAPVAMPVRYRRQERTFPRRENCASPTMPRGVPLMNLCQYSSTSRDCKAGSPGGSSPVQY